jgi:hypothetical protein
MKKKNILSNDQNKNLNNKEDEIMKREEIKTEIEELIKEIKEEEKELEFFDGELLYHDCDTNTISKNYNDIDEAIWDYVDNKFIYYSEANKFLENYNIFEETKNYNCEFGTIPENECQLAAYILQNEIYNNDYNTIEKIYSYLDELEELQEELGELEELDEDYEER